MSSQSKKPPSWVLGRNSCRADLKYEAIHQLIKRDMNEFANILIEDRQDGRKFKLVENDEGVTPVYHVEQHGVDCEREVTFTLAGRDRISVEGYVNLKVIVRWCAKSKACVLRIEGDNTQKAYEPWEIVQLALEPLFFDPLD